MVRRKPRTPRPKRARRARRPAGRSVTRLHRRWLGAFRRLPEGVRLLLILGITVTLSLGANWLYQVARKPSELFFPVSGTLNKSPAETWAAYGPLFRKYSTTAIAPELLAALAQVEAAGNPVARTYWRWSFPSDPGKIYRPASSAVGMYQVTDGTFAEARRFCIRDHVVVEDGPWNAFRSCWFNSLYTRVVPAHAVELVAAHLDGAVTGTLAQYRLTHASPRQKQELATLVHLCGAGAGQAYARRGLKLAPGQRCGDHDARAYLARVREMQTVFAKLAGADSS